MFNNISQWAAMSKGCDLLCLWMDVKSYYSNLLTNVHVVSDPYHNINIYFLYYLFQDHQDTTTAQIPHEPIMSVE